MTPEISVVIPTFNRPELVERAIGSIKEPDLDVEIVVVDDASTDSTSERLRDRPGISYIRLSRNGGPAAARNAGIAAARAPYIAFLDSDDERVPGSLARQLDELKAHPECALVHGRYRFTGAAEAIGFSSGGDTQQPAVGDVYWRLFRFNLIAPSTIVLATESLRAAGGFDARYRRSEEWDLWLRLCSRGHVCAVDDVVAQVLAASDAEHASGDPVLIETTSALVVRRHLASPYCRPMSARKKRRIYRDFCRLRVDLMLWKTIMRGPRADLRLRFRCLLACARLAPLHLLSITNTKNVAKLLLPGAAQ